MKCPYTRKKTSVSSAQGRSVSHPVVPDSLRPRGLQPTRPLCLWDSPGKDNGVVCCFLLQGDVMSKYWGHRVTTFQKEMSQDRLSLQWISVGNAAVWGYHVNEGKAGFLLK